LAEIKRILLEQVDLALWELETPGLDVDAAVHEARKSFKRVRGMLRLVRDEMEPATYVRLNSLFRDAGRALSDMRTSAVLSETLEKVRERFPHRLSQDEAARLVHKLRNHHEALRGEMAPRATLFRLVAADLRRGRKLILTLPLVDNKFPAGGMRRVYARGRRGLRRCRQDDAAANFHEWRKRVKYLRYHVRVFSPAWPPVLDGLTGELVLLSELLGLDHDLAELHLTLVAHPELRLREPDAGKSLALIETYRAELEAQAFSIGLRVYAEKPDAFVSRMRAYWRAWLHDW
jgi:CHAD domain-containing protein